MFEQVLNTLYPNNPAIPFNINPRAQLALTYSNQHPVVIDTINRMMANYHMDSFSRDDLADVWSRDDFPFASKYLATLWWGNKSRYPSVAYSSENIDGMGNPDLENALSIIQHCPDWDGMTNHLRDLVVDLECRGNYYLPQIGPAFFTKIIEFYFVTHPLLCNPSFLPIISDKWLRRAVFAEMTERGDIPIRDQIFASPETLRIRQGSIWSSYFDFILYFNERVGQLSFVYPGLTPFMLEGYLFSDTGKTAADAIIGDTPVPNTDNRTPTVSALNPGIKLRTRNVCFGYKIIFDNQPYYLFVGYTKTYHYLELLTGSDDQSLTACRVLPELRQRGFSIEKRNYIYKKLVPYNEQEALVQLEQIKELFA